MEEAISIYCDGGSRGNPGKAASAFVVQKGKRVIFSDSKYLGKTTNNVAEYSAVAFALEWVLENKNLVGEEINFILDSELAVKQILGVYKVKNKNLKELHTKIKKMLSEIKLKINFTRVEREKNKIADYLVNEKLDSLP
jgi:ribonuclease HI